MAAASSAAAVAEEEVPSFEDWHPDVWAALLAEGRPFTWSDAQKFIGPTCRTLGYPYGTDSKGRIAKFKSVMAEYYGADWKERASAVQRSAKLQAQDAEQVAAAAGENPQVVGIDLSTAPAADLTVEPDAGGVGGIGAEAYTIHSSEVAQDDVIEVDDDADSDGGRASLGASTVASIPAHVKGMIPTTMRRRLLKTETPVSLGRWRFLIAIIMVKCVC